MQVNDNGSRHAFIAGKSSSFFTISTIKISSINKLVNCVYPLKELRSKIVSLTVMYKKYLCSVSYRASAQTLHSKVSSPGSYEVPSSDDSAFAGVWYCSPEGDASAEGGSENGLMLLTVHHTDAHCRSRERWPANKLQLSKKQ